MRMNAADLSDAKILELIEQAKTRPAEGLAAVLLVASWAARTGRPVTFNPFCAEREPAFRREFIETYARAKAHAARPDAGMPPAPSGPAGWGNEGDLLG